MAKIRKSSTRQTPRLYNKCLSGGGGGIISLLGLRSLLLVFLVSATILYLHVIFYGTNRDDYNYLSSTTNINNNEENSIIPKITNVGDGGPSSSAASAASTSFSMSAAAYKQSFGLFDDISEPMWNRMRDTARRTGWYTNPTNPLYKVKDETFWLGNNLYPNFHCPHIERVGGGEGTKFLCYPHRLVDRPEVTKKKECLIYSVGCAGDFNFEDAMSLKYNKECEIHVFDPADWTRKNDIEKKNIHYHPWGLVSTYDKNHKSVVWPKGRGGGFKTFQESLDILGHQNRTVDIFKIDCEGCEWSTHKDWIGFGKMTYLFIYLVAVFFIIFYLIHFYCCSCPKNYVPLLI